MSKPSEEYIKGMNDYMENHWQYHNHLDHKRHQERIKYVGGFCKGLTIEVGCGNGYSTKLMQDTYPDTIFVGVEPTDWGYAEAQKNYRDISFIKAFAEDLPCDDMQFDTVLLAEIIEHVEDPRKVVEEAWRVCGGRLIITHPVNLAGQKNDPTHLRFYDRPSMIEFCKPYGKPDFFGLDKEGNITFEEDKIFFGIAIIDREGFTYDS